MRFGFWLFSFLLFCLPIVGLAASSQVVEGRIENVIIDSFSKGAEEQTLLHPQEGAAPYELKLLGVNLSGYRSGDRVKVTGTLSGKTIEVNTAVAGQGIETLSSAQTLSFGTPQQRSVAVIIVESNDAAAPATVSQMQGVMWNWAQNIAAWYNESTNGQIILPPDSDGDPGGQVDVFGPFHINYNIAGACDTYTWRGAALGAAYTAGVNTAAYNHLLVLLPRGSACGYAGIATVGCSNMCAVTVLGEYWNLQDVWTHEMGHNFGMGHAGYDENNDGTLDDHGVLSQYIDHSCTMGEGGVGFRHFNGPHKGEMSWIPETKYLTITESGRYKIAALELAPDGLPSDQVQLLRFAYPGRTGAYFYVSYRAQARSYSANLEAKYRNKVNIHWKGTSSQTYFVKALNDGEQFKEPGQTICVTQVDHSESSHYATVDVSFSCGDTTVPAEPVGLRMVN